MRESEDLKANRRVLVPVSLVSLTIPLQVIGLLKVENQAAFALPFAVYLAFIILVATFQTLIARRLFAMHRVRRFVFDIQIWFLVVSMLACPLAGANFFAHWWYQVELDASQASLQNVRWVSAVVLYFLLLPIFFLTESVFTGACRLAHRRQTNGESKVR